MSRDSRSRPAGGKARIYLLGLVLTGLALVAFWVAREGWTDQPVEAGAGYERLAGESRLQVDLEALPADVSWRDHAGLPDVTDTGPPSWLDQIPVGFVARLMFWTFIAIVAATLIFAVYVIVRHAAAGRWSVRSVPSDSGHGRVVRAEADAATPLPTLDAVLAMDDLVVAIGALQRLGLEAAARATGTMLRRSETARDTLRRLPGNWPHREAVSVLVREAERVRFAGGGIDRARLDEIAGSLRGLLREAGIRQSGTGATSGQPARDEA